MLRQPKQEELDPVTAPDPLQPAEDFQARVLEGRGFGERGDFATAERIFRRLLDASRGLHPGNHARALASLVTLYGRAGRYLEAHVLARCLATLAVAAGPASDTTLAFALGKLCGALSQLRLTEPLGEALGELRAVLDRPQVPSAIRFCEVACASVVLALQRTGGDVAKRCGSETCSASNSQSWIGSCPSVAPGECHARPGHHLTRSSDFPAAP